MSEAAPRGEHPFTDLSALRPEQRCAKRTKPPGSKRPPLSTLSSRRDGARQHHHDGSTGSGCSSLQLGSDRAAPSSTRATNRHLEANLEENRSRASQISAGSAHTFDAAKQNTSRRGFLNQTSTMSTARSPGSSLATSRNGDVQMSFSAFSSLGRGSISTQSSRQRPASLASQAIRRASVSASRNGSLNHARPQTPVCIDLTQVDSDSASSDSDLPDYDDSSSPTNQPRHDVPRNVVSRGQASPPVLSQSTRQPPHSHTSIRSERTSSITAALQRSPNSRQNTHPPERQDTNPARATISSVQRLQEINLQSVRNLDDLQTLQAVTASTPTEPSSADFSQFSLRPYQTSRSSSQDQGHIISRSQPSQGCGPQSSLPSGRSDPEVIRTGNGQSESVKATRLPSIVAPREKPRFISPPARDSSSPEIPDESQVAISTAEGAGTAKAVTQPVARDSSAPKNPDEPQIATPTADIRISNVNALIQLPSQRLPSLAERLRQRRLEIFDSDALDAAIYQQEGTYPPAGLQIPIKALRQTIPLPAFAQRQAFNANRYIHGMHPPLSPADQAAKDAAIAARGGRKLWFQRVAARQTMRVHKYRGLPVWQRPRIAYRGRDISFLAEHELPRQVRENDGWMVFWKWRRGERLKACGTQAAPGR